MTDVITLVNESLSPDEYGDLTATVTERTVFAERKSISQKEFYESAAVGLKPEIKFVLADEYDFQNEKKLKYGTTVYRILRTFRTGKELEIICATEVNP